MYELKDSPLKGKGLFAATTISKGRSILSEKSTSVSCLAINTNPDTISIEQFQHIKKRCYNDRNCMRVFQNYLQEYISKDPPSDPARVLSQSASFGALGQFEAYMSSLEPADFTILDRLAGQYKIPIGELKRQFFFVSMNTIGTVSGYTPEGDVICGQGLFPELQQVNHSCEPNCTIAFKGDKKYHLFSLRSIEPGEELTYKYCSDFSASFFTPCRCQKCTTTCRTCGKTQVGLSVCGRCRSVYYCGRTCQLSDWTLHKRVCVNQTI